MNEASDVILGGCLDTGQVKQHPGSAATPPLQPATSPAALAAHLNLRPFVAEALVSAGPRKSADEYAEDRTNAELCEDCAGICWVADRLVFWLCDGASNGKVLPRLFMAEGEG